MSLEAGVLSKGWKDKRRHRWLNNRVSAFIFVDPKAFPRNDSPVVYYRSEGEPIQKEELTVPPLPTPPFTDSPSALLPVERTLFSSDTALIEVPESEVTIVDTKELVLVG